MRELVKAHVRKRAGDKTLSVVVTSDRKHGTFGKFIRKVRGFQVHDEHNLFWPGDVVWIRRTRPRSKHKAWEVLVEGTF